MMREAIDIILKAWTSPEPFDWNGKVWQGKNWKIIPKPLTKPRPDVGIACARTDTTLELAAEKGFLPLLSWTSPPPQSRDDQDLSRHAGIADNPPVARTGPRFPVRRCRRFRGGGEAGS